MKLLLVGSFGCGNIGDEAAFFSAEKNLVGEKIQAYVNYPTYHTSIAHSEIENFSDYDAMVFSGGNIFHSEYCITANYNYARSAKLKSKPVYLISVGCEDCPDYGLASKLVEISDSSSFRNNFSASKFASTKIHDDLVFLLKPDKIQEKENWIGFTPSGDDMFDIQLLNFLLKSWNVKLMCHVLQPNFDNQEFINILNLYMRSKFYQTKKMVRLVYTTDVNQMLSEYSPCFGVISGRWHGMIFGKINGCRVLPLGGGNKSRIFYEQYGGFEPLKSYDENRLNKFLQ